MSPLRRHALLALIVRSVPWLRLMPSKAYYIKLQFSALCQGEPRKSNTYFSTKLCCTSTGEACDTVLRVSTVLQEYAPNTAVRAVCQHRSLCLVSLQRFGGGAFFVVSVLTISSFLCDSFL